MENVDYDTCFELSDLCGARGSVGSGDVQMTPSHSIRQSV